MHKPSIVLLFLGVTLGFGCFSKGAKKAEVAENLVEKYSLEPPDQLVLFGNKRFIPQQGLRAVYQLFWADPNIKKDDPPNLYQIECKTKPSEEKLQTKTHQFLYAFNISLGVTKCHVAILDESGQQISDWSQEVKKEIVEYDEESMENNVHEETNGVLDKLQNKKNEMVDVKAMNE